MVEINSKEYEEYVRFKIMQQQLQLQLPAIAEQPVKVSLGQRLVQNMKNRMITFHQNNLERQRQNRLMKRKNPKKYAKMVKDRREMYNVFNQPNLFKDGRGTIKW